MALLPRDEKFFGLFAQQAEVVVQATTVLHDCASGATGLEIGAKNIAALEQRGDDILHDIEARLNRTFILPLDPEDIHNLAFALDEVIDEIERAINRLTIYKLDPMPAPMQELTRTVDASARVIQQSFDSMNQHGLERREDLLQHAKEINRLEQETEDGVRAALTALFESEHDPIALIKQKEIYDRLESIGDTCEAVADLLDGVIAKHS